MSPQSNIPHVFGPLLSLLFEKALLSVSAYLTEAQFAGEQGQEKREEELLAAAEAYAVQTGYLELMNLVWAYAETPPKQGFPHIEF